MEAAAATPVPRSILKRRPLPHVVASPAGGCAVLATPPHAPFPGAAGGLHRPLSPVAPREVSPAGWAVKRRLSPGPGAGGNQAENNAGNNAGNDAGNNAGAGAENNGGGEVGAAGDGGACHGSPKRQCTSAGRPRCALSNGL